MAHCEEPPRFAVDRHGRGAVRSLGDRLVVEQMAQYGKSPEENRWNSRGSTDALTLGSATSIVSFCPKAAQCAQACTSFAGQKTPPAKQMSNKAIHCEEARCTIYCRAIEAWCTCRRAPRCRADRARNKVCAWCVERTYCGRAPARFGHTGVGRGIVLAFARSSARRLVTSGVLAIFRARNRHGCRRSLSFEVTAGCIVHLVDIVHHAGSSRVRPIVDPPVP